MDEKYYDKYLKYKTKYLKLKNNIIGGSKREKIDTNGNYIDTTDTYMILLNFFREKINNEYIKEIGQYFMPNTDPLLCDNNCSDLFNLIIYWLFGGNNDNLYIFDINQDMYIIDYMNICKIITEILEYSFFGETINGILYYFIKNKLSRGNYIIISYKGGCNLNIETLLSFESNFLTRFLNKTLFIYSYTLPKTTTSNIDDFIFWIFVIYFYTIYKKNLQNLYIITNDKQRINIDEKIIFNRNNLNDILNYFIIYYPEGTHQINNIDMTLFMTFQNILQTNYVTINETTIFDNIKKINEEFSVPNSLEISEMFLMLIKKIQYNIYDDFNGSIDQQTIKDILSNPDYKLYIHLEFNQRRNKKEVRWRPIPLIPLM